jgi:transaldolase
MAVLARTIRELYDPQRKGTAFLIDGLCDEETLVCWLREGVVGQTSNQTLFLARVEAGQLDQRIAHLYSEGKTPEQIFNILYNEEALRSAEAIRRWVDEEHLLGFSRETDATRASEASAIVEEAQEIQSLSPWVLVKLANVGPSPQAIRAMIRDAVAWAARQKSPRCVNPNITLVFGVHHYVNTVAGYIEGLEEVSRHGGAIRTIRSVNSLFVSRLDTAVDRLIDAQLSAQTDALEQTCLRLLKGKTALANAKVVYRVFRAIFLGEPFEDPYGLFVHLQHEIAELAARFRALGPEAPIQRLLIASSSNKKPGVYSDLIYVLPLLGPYLANTLPLETLEALRRKLAEEDFPVRDTVFDPIPWMEQTGQTVAAWEDAVARGGGPGAKAPDEVLLLVVEKVLQPAGRTLEQVTDELRDQGAQAFARDQWKAYELFEKKVASLATQAPHRPSAR